MSGAERVARNFGEHPALYSHNVNAAMELLTHLPQGLQILSMVLVIQIVNFAPESKDSANPWP